MAVSKRRRNAPRKPNRADRQRAMRLHELRSELTPRSGLMLHDFFTAATGYPEPGPYRLRSEPSGDREAAGLMLPQMAYAEKFDMGILPLMPSLTPGGGFQIPKFPDEFTDWTAGKLNLPKPKCWFEFYLPGVPEVRYGHFVVEDNPSAWSLNVFQFDWEDEEFFWDGLTKQVTNRAAATGFEQIEFSLSGCSSEYRENRMREEHDIIGGQLKLSIFMAAMLTRGPKTTRVQYGSEPSPFDHWKVELVRHSGMTPEVLASLTWEDLPRLEPIDVDHFRAMITYARMLFRKKFGRDPRPTDPLYFDPAADTPQPQSVDKVRRNTLSNIAQMDAPPAVAYAYAKTGLMIHDQNRHGHTPEQIQQWEAALVEYEELDTEH